MTFQQFGFMFLKIVLYDRVGKEIFFGKVDEYLSTEQGKRYLAESAAEGGAV